MDEKQRILKLLSDNVITVEEAEILLKAFDNKTNNSNEKSENNTKSQQTPNDFEKKFDEFSQQLGSFVKDSLKIVEVKMDELFKKTPKE